MEDRSDAPGAVTARPNYLVRHWRGELPLGISYWLNGSLLGNLVPALVVGAAMAAHASPNGTLRITTSLALAAIVLSLATYVWSIVGIWRSAGRHVQRGGKAGWATAAKVFVVFGLVSVLGNLSRSHLAAQTAELARISFGLDPIDKISATVSPDGRTMLLHGTLGEGSASKVRLLLESSAGIRTVALDSAGGRLYEALAIADEIRTRQLDTYAEGLCASACTLVFLAGRDRGATPNARIGFHRPSFAGQDSVDLPGSDQMITAYQAAGISSAFLARVRETSSESMWYPSRAELIANHVVTRVSLGGETASGLMRVTSPEDLRAAFALVPLWSAVDARFPGSMERAVQLAWTAKQRGASDDDVMTAGRAVISDLVPKALTSASDEHLERFLGILREELAASLAVSPQACSKLLAGQLNIASTLPAAIVNKEAAFMQTLFSEPPQHQVAAPSQEAAGRALAPALQKLTPAQIEVVSAPDKFTTQPQRQCSALMAFYDEIAHLALPSRRVALRILFGSGSS